MQPESTASSAGPSLPGGDSDREHLKLLAIFHFVYAGLIMLISGLAGIYTVFGAVMLGASFQGKGPNAPPPEIGGLFMCLGAFLMLLGWTVAGLVAFSGRKLLQHRGRLYCMVIAGLLCLNIPLGTILGVFTLVVLSRPSVRQLFGDA